MRVSARRFGILERRNGAPARANQSGREKLQMAEPGIKSRPNAKDCGPLKQKSQDVWFGGDFATGKGCNCLHLAYGTALRIVADILFMPMEWHPA